MVPNRWGLPQLGLGIGLRSVHYGSILEQQPAIDWFEIISENYLDTEGRPLEMLDQIAARYPIALHGVSMSLGSTDPLDYAYLRKLRSLAERVRAHWLGDHVCWTGVAGRNSHELLPLPYTEACLAHLVERTRAVQDFLGRPLVLENPSTYVRFVRSSMSEAEFIGRLAEEADCALLLDVNNIYVSSRNHGFEPLSYLESIPYERVVQIHLAGHSDHGSHCVDTHSGPVIDPVWQLYAEAIQRAGPRATLLEWDADIPSLDVVHREVLKAERFGAGLEASHG